MIAQIIINSFVQLAIFSIIPVIWWLFSARKKEKLLPWLGLRLPVFNNKPVALATIALAFVLLLVPGIYLLVMFEDTSILANAMFAGLGFGGIIPILIYSIVQTGLSEEIFFRGFLNKRLCNKFGFAIGNTIQSILFGLLHGVLLLALDIGLLFVVLVTVFSLVAGWMMGYINEKLSNGSIFPSWVIHSIKNIVSSALILTGVVAVL